MLTPAQFETFLAEHRSMLVLRAEQITGDHGTAEDVVQATTTYLLDHLNRYDPAKPLLPWVLEAVKRRAFNALELMARFVPLIDGLDEQHPQIFAQPGPDEDSEFNHQAFLLLCMWQVIEEEDPEHYHLVKGLIDGAGLAELGPSRQAAHQMLQRALKRWRKILTQHFTKAEIKVAKGG